MQARLTLADVRRLVAELPEEQRAALMLVAVDGLSYADAAGVLGVPAGTVASRVARARLALAAALEGKEVAGCPAGDAPLGRGVDDGQGRSGHAGGLSRSANWTAGARPGSSSALAADPELRGRLASLERVDAALERRVRSDPDRAAAGIALDRAASSTPPRASYGNPPLRPVARLGLGSRHWRPDRRLRRRPVRPGAGLRSQPLAVAAIQAELPDVLESEISGTTVAFNDPVQGISGTVKPVSTFLNADGSYCRAYEAQRLARGRAA